MTEKYPRIAGTLDEAERNSIWQYADPIWPAHYAWHPDEGWLYCTKSNPNWRPSNVGHDAVSPKTITGESESQSDYHFVEIVRYCPGRSIIFTPRGPIDIPESIETKWADR